MATIDDYRRIIRELIEYYGQFPPSHGDVRAEVIIDPVKDHYELIFAGWSGTHRIHGSVIHIDIIGDKVWVEHDGTEVGVAEELVEKGIPRDRIVLGFKHPSMRPITDFATA